ncbi:Ku protein [Dokdonella sp.]|uniref:non-homologous end joining protein Ku n=1 Tax=Dokdonella sp. TaxID=2291710 RepID=UPI001B025573|nr:Ku protein [Dokdonella sp.]MBO9662890.1 Ku protein [Dokdonella sp.]
MARAIWSGTLSFGLLQIPVKLMSAERRTDLHFRMLDSRDNAPIRYERVNSETGDEVPWKDIVKAFEYRKGNYVVIEEEDLRAAAPQSHESVDVEAFVDAGSISPRHFEKPYVLVPGTKAQKGYVLLRETLAKAGKIGIARVVVRTREYLAAVIPEGDALVLMLVRYAQELIDLDDFELPKGPAADYRVTRKELEMARQLVDSMAGKWDPADYQDEFRTRLHEVIEKRMRSGKTVTPPETEEAAEEATNVVDFMKLLKKSLESKRPRESRPAKKTKSKPAAKKAAPRRRRSA